MKKDKSNEKNNENPQKTGRGHNPNSKKNLKPIKPGEVRNPTGRPKGALDYKTRVGMAIDLLAEKLVNDYNKKNKKKISVEDIDIYGDIFQQAINKARNGDLKAIIDFFDRLYGKATQPIEMSGKDGNPIEYEIMVKEGAERLRKFQSKWFKKPVLPEDKK